MASAKLREMYCALWEPMLDDVITKEDVLKYAEELPKFHAFLTCCGCGQLLTGRKIRRTVNKCGKHVACEACAKKEGKEGNECSLCEDWSTFVEDEAFEFWVPNHQLMCLYILTNRRIVRIMEEIHAEGLRDMLEMIEEVGRGLKGSQDVKEVMKMKHDRARARANLLASQPPN